MSDARPPTGFWPEVRAAKGDAFCDAVQAECDKADDRCHCIEITAKRLGIDTECMSSQQMVDAIQLVARRAQNGGHE